MSTTERRTSAWIRVQQSRRINAPTSRDVSDPQRGPGTSPPVVGVGSLTSRLRSDADVIGRRKAPPVNGKFATGFAYQPLYAAITWASRREELLAVRIPSPGRAEKSNPWGKSRPCRLFPCHFPLATRTAEVNVTFLHPKLASPLVGDFELRNVLRMVRNRHAPKPDGNFERRPSTLPKASAIIKRSSPGIRQSCGVSVAKVAPSGPILVG
jgi:hypothetical protein